MSWPLPNHEAYRKMSVVEQARVSGRNIGRRERTGPVFPAPERTLAVLLMNAKCAAHHAEIKEAFDTARAEANPPFRFVVI